MEWKSFSTQNVNLNSPVFRKELGSRLRQVRASKGRTAESVATAVGISEFNLAAIECGLEENVDVALLDKIAHNLGLVDKLTVAPPPSQTTPTLSTQETVVTKKRKSRKAQARYQGLNRDQLKALGQEIKAKRKAAGMSREELAEQSGIGVPTIQVIEAKGISIWPQRARELLEIISEHDPKEDNHRIYESETTVLKSRSGSIKSNKPKGFGNVRKTKSLFMISTEHKIRCGEYQLSASISSQEFSLTIESQSDAIILEGNKTDKQNVLAALRAMIETIEGN